ncbi:unnamed protein product [Alternaria sp. RS040]
MPPSNMSIDSINATAFALMYGYSLTLYAQTFEPTLQAVGVNAIQYEESLSTQDLEVLVRSNVDTLYSKAAVDLSHADVVLSLPDVPVNRYYVVPFYDLYGNNFANLGTVINSFPGDHLITVAGDDEPGLLMLDTDNHGGFKYKGIIKSLTAYRGIMLRIVLKNNTTDVDEVKAIQSQIKMTTVSVLLGNVQISPAAFLLPFNFSVAQMTQTLQLLAQLNEANQPVERSDLDRVNSMLAAAGINNGNYTAPACLDYAQVYKIMGKEFMSLLDPSSHASNQNGWFSLLPSMSDNFGIEYTARAYIAWLPSARRLPANESYIMTFSGKPPVTGFWSLTAYDSTNYLVPNDLNRYAWGDRSNLTYPDGTLVYADTDSDGAFSILIQPTDVVPSSNWTNSWLPAPVGGGEFTVNCGLI